MLIFYSRGMISVYLPVCLALETRYVSGDFAKAQFGQMPSNDPASHEERKKKRGIAFP